MFAMLLKSGECLSGFFKVEEVLYVDGSLLTFLKLPCDILRPRIRMPLGQVALTQSRVRVVVSTQEVD